VKTSLFLTPIAKSFFCNLDEIQTFVKSFVEEGKKICSIEDHSVLKLELENAVISGYSQT